MTVSVIITTHNRFALFQRAWGSVLKQKHKPCELIVVEDGFCSGVEEWIKNNRYSNVRYVRHSKNKGLAAARNTGWKMAVGEYIAFLDDDDWWEPQKLEKQIEIINNLQEQQYKHLGLIYCGAKRIHEKNGKVKINMPVHEGSLKESIIKLKRLKTVSSSFLFKREVLNKIDGFDENLPSSIDHDIWMKLAVAGYHVYHIGEPLVVVPYIADQSSMMLDLENRLAGVKLFIEKWQPTFESFFGEKRGKEFSQKYYTNVISQLAASKIKTDSISNYYRCVRSIFRFSRFYFFNSYSILRYTIPVIMKKNT